MNPIPHKHRIEELRDKVLDVAMGLLAESEFDSMRLEHVAERSKIDPGELARIFPDKSAVLSALLSRIYHRLMYLLEHAAAGTGDSMDALERMFQSHASFISKNPAIPRLLFNLSQSDDPQLRAQVVRIIADYESGLAVLMGQAKAEGRMRADVDTHAAAMLFIAMIHGLVFRALMTGEMQALAEGAQSVLPVYLHGIRTGAPPGTCPPGAGREG